MQDEDKAAVGRKADWLDLTGSITLHLVWKYILIYIELMFWHIYIYTCVNSSFKSVFIHSFLWKEMW